MIIKAAVLETLRQLFSGLFQDGLNAPGSEWEKIATRIKSSSKGNTYGWMGKFPRLREWIGSRTIKSIQEHGYTIMNKKFESTVGVDRADIEDDNLGMYNPLFLELGSSTREHVDENIYELLAAGFTTLCYDGQNFFDTDHPVNDTEDGSGADASVPNIINPVVVDQPPWFLLDTGHAIKPLIFQERSLPQLEFITNPQQDTVFMEDQYLFGARVRRNFGFGFWQMAVASRDVLNEANFNAAYKAMMEFKTDGNRKLGMKPVLLVVSPANRAAGQSLIKAQFGDGGKSNTNFESVELLVSRWM